jgi:hypothetical protein
MAYPPKTPKIKEPSEATKARGRAALKRARAAREATRNTPSGATQNRNRVSGTSPRTNRSMNALDKAISQGKTLPSKNTRIPGDTDVKMKGMKAKPVIKLKKK